MSVADLFQKNLKDIKPLTSLKNAAYAPYKAASASVNLVSMDKLFSSSAHANVSAPSGDVASLLSFKLANVPSVSKPELGRDITEKASEDVSNVKAELEQVKALNSKYLEVINQINEELLKVKSETKSVNENAFLAKENKDLKGKVTELSNAIINLVQQNKTLSRALGLR